MQGTTHILDTRQNTRLSPSPTTNDVMTVNQASASKQNKLVLSQALMS